MADLFSIFGQLSQLNPPGKTRDSEEAPVDKDSPRKPRAKKRGPAVNRQKNEKTEEEVDNSADADHPSPG